MKAEIRITIDVEDEAAAAAAREALAERAAELGHAVEGSASAMAETAFRVAGVDLSTKAPFEVLLPAPDAETAKEAVETPNRIVALVEEAGPEAAVESPPSQEPGGKGSP